MSTDRFDVLGTQCRVSATAPSGSCDLDLNPPSSWPQPLVLSLAPKCCWEREASSGGKAQGGLEWWFLAGEVPRAAGLRGFSLCLARKVNLGVQAFGIVDLIIISAAPQSEMLKQRPLQGL